MPAKFELGEDCSRFVLTGEEMSSVDRMAIESRNIPSLALMEQACLRVAHLARTLAANGKVFALCGGGNNGGDGLGAARLLHGWGYSVTVLMAQSIDRLSQDARRQYLGCCGMGVPMLHFGDWSSETLRGLSSSDLVIDALLGTGLTGPVRSEMNVFIDAVNESQASVLSVDVPSGVCAEKGEILGCAVRANQTVTFQASKLGHWLFPGATFRGHLSIADIGLPRSLLTPFEARRLMLDDDLAPAFANREPNSHKGNFGHVAVVGGRAGVAGAVMMAADAALASGAGLATVCTQKDLIPMLTRDAYEVMLRAEFPTTVSADWASRLVLGYDALVVGPGFPLGTTGQEMVFALVGNKARPCVIDADGLNHLVGHLEMCQGGDFVLTPHPGEAARLLGITSAEVQADRVGAVRALVSATKNTVVLKGAHTLVGSPDGELGICIDGNPGMASAGMGDVLAGIIGACLARGLEPKTAARAAVVWHARSGDWVEKKQGQNHLRARDVIDALGKVEQCWKNSQLLKG